MSKKKGNEELKLGLYVFGMFLLFRFWYGIQEMIERLENTFNPNEFEEYIRELLKPKGGSYE